MLVSLGAIYDKIFVWHTGFWGEKTYGWHYDVLFLVMNLVIVFTNGGDYVLTK
jgi:putative oxidoreductase